MTTRRAHRHGARLVLLALFTALALVAAACGGGDDDRASGGDGTTTTTDPGPPQPGGKIVYALSAETDGWDPSASRWSPSGLVVANAIFDTLTRFNDEGEIEPYLAESLTPNDDYTEWTIKLRPDVTFHNGEPLDAAAVIKNIEFHVNSNLTGPIFDQIESAEPVPGDDLSLVVHTKEPFWNLPVALSTQIGVVAAPAMLDSEDRARHPIGTGPFKFESWTPDASLTVVKNEDYWQTDEFGNQLPYLDEIEFRPIIDPTTRAQSLESGTVDMAQMNEPVALSAFEDPGSGFHIYTDPDSEQDEVFVMLNTQKPPFDDKTAREALAYATNREVLAETVGEGTWEPAEGPFRKTSPWYTDVDYPDYDPERARQLVEEYEEEHGPLEFVIWSNPSSFSREIVQLLDQMWADVGIDVEIENRETSQLIAAVITGNYEATLWLQFGSAHPLLETVWWHCNFVSPDGEIGLNFARNCNEELSQALDDARHDDDPANQKGYYATVQEQIAADLPYIFLMHTDVAIVARDGVVSVFDYALPSGNKGLPINNGAHPLQQVWLKR